jgi:beta-galactosidase
VTSVGKCPDRNYFIPKDADHKFSPYNEGARSFSLNGEWLFDFFENAEDYDVRGKRGLISVQVPCAWQYYGKDAAAYVNDKYTFPFDPPNIYPRDGKFGYYKKTFGFKKKAGRGYYAVFEGCDSCLYLYVNGKFIGYNQVSHSNAEFDIGAALKNGENTVEAYVYKYSVGSYFECQDKFRLNGIFRDVYILERDAEHIESYTVGYELRGGVAEVRIAFKETSPLSKKINVSFGGKSVYSGSCDGAECVFTLSGVALWNSEQPNIYHLEILAGAEKICEYLCFRTVTLENNIFKINGKHIKLLGANRHDSYYETGHYASLDVLKTDLTLMKDSNMNAIRTSHYPPQAEMMLLCDEMGFYVVEEADIETHGAVKRDGGHDEKLFDILTDDPVFTANIADRINRMVTRDFNRASVIMWSMGNEAGYGQVILAEIKKLMSRDKTRLVHYESYYGRDFERNNHRMSFVSKMYADVHTMREFLKKDERAFMLCEYSCAMGNSCGDLQDYVDCFYENDRFMGGMVWEWNEHSFPIGLDFNKPGYGGDYGERVHDNNCCTNGIIDHIRRPNSSLLEFKYSACKVTAVFESGAYYLVNKYDFRSISGKDYRVEIVYEGQDGKQKRTSFTDFDLAVGERVAMPVTPRDNALITFYFYKDGKEIGKKQFGAEAFTYQMPPVSKKGVKIKETPYDVIAEAAGFRYTVDKRTAMIKRLTAGGEALVSGAKLRMGRAPIDNDRHIASRLTWRGVFGAYSVVKCDPLVTATGVTFDFAGVTDGVSNLIEGQIAYEFDANGSVLVSLCGKIPDNVEFLHRVGIEFGVRKDAKMYTYFGYGPYESYCDKKSLATLGLYKADVSADRMYLKPQESNSHYNTYRVTVSGSDFDLTAEAAAPFSFNYGKYDIEELMSKKHNYDLCEGEVYPLIIDYKMSGVASSIVGAPLEDKYKIVEKNVAYTFTLRPAKSKNLS